VVQNPVPPQMPQLPEKLGRYSVFAEIASGGMATVHLGRLIGTAGFSRTVAIKRLHPHLAKDPNFVSMFLDEARLAARIRHPNVVHIIDVAAEEGELLLVMEYVLGETVGRIIRAASLEQLRIPPPVVSSIMIGALDGLHAAHEATSERGHPLGIVHRDMSPQNVIVGKDGVARLLDFGVAKADGRMHETRDGSVKGKFAYMAPEQIERDHVDRRTDIFSASIVLWEALTGERLFLGETPAKLVHAVLNDEMRAPSQVAASLPQKLDAVVMKGLARDPNQRYATARDMAMALERACRPASAREVGEWIDVLVGRELRERQAMVEAIEAESSPPSERMQAHFNTALASGSSPPHHSGSQMAEMAVGDGVSISTVARVGRPSGPGYPPDASTNISSASLLRGTSQSTQSALLALRQTTVPWSRALAVLGVVTALGMVGLISVIAFRPRPGAGGAPQIPSSNVTPVTSGPVEPVVPVTPPDPVAASSQQAPPPELLPKEPPKEPVKEPVKEVAAKEKEPPREREAPPPRRHDPPPRPEKKTASGPATNECDNPFTVDPVSGIKKPKPQCFK
jgi:serine/threonine protein kinase